MRVKEEGGRREGRIACLLVCLSVSASPCALSCCVSCLFSCAVSCRAVPCPCVCLSCHFSSVCSCLPQGVLRSVCLLCEALDSPNGFMFFLLVTVSSTFLVSCPTRFVKKVLLEVWKSA